MTKPTRKRPRLGDVVRITDADGQSAIAQYVAKNREFGHLVRVLRDTGSSIGDADAGSLAQKPTQFVTFFPLGAACHRGIATIIGPAEIPPEFHRLPVFRQALRLNPASRDPCNWILWDGEREWIVERLSTEEYRFPIRCIMNDTLLVDRALSGWTAEQDR